MNIKQYICVGAVAALLGACNPDVLDRPELTKVNDNTFWKNETDLRLYANDFYVNYFVGYNSGFGTAYTPLRGYIFADDFTQTGTQSGFETTVPNSRGASTATPTILTQYSGPNWNFYWVRKANVMLSRMKAKMDGNIPAEQYNHWEGVGRLFRGYEYSRLVSVFGDVPYFDQEVDPSDDASMYKERTPRGEVMDKVYEDFKFALANIRLNDGVGYVNRYVAAAVISNLILFEGSWQHYHKLDAARAKKYLELAVEASELVMNSGKYSFNSDFKALFASENLANNPEVIFFRAYESPRLTHAIGSYSNGTEGQAQSANLNLLKSFICTDGDVWQNSKVDNAKSFHLRNLVVTRDPRFEATFLDTVNTPAATLAYAHKFAGREARNYMYGGSYPAAWGSNTNTNDAPVHRLAEVVLNWVEAKQILAESFGGAPVSQADLDKSINAIRNRPLDAVAIAKGVKKTAPLQLNAIPNDPTRDADVSPLMWEIRRERRMEFVYEHTRLNDLRRWKKLNYMDFQNPDYAAGPWLDVNKDLKTQLTASFVGRLRVMKEDGTIVTYNGNNAADMVGYYVVQNFANRVSFTDRVYLAPLGRNEIQAYKERGFTLTQNPGWGE
ncbi:RagB/SusD domain protein [Leadbetterella byssophila DSM 17132]|uniref:RagB/SusD domain protein n=1 Tax=Leadbetterella byssophila (strain DSM 17132 / JCM 16389 / KACC 11308 / NBRC 106382 / 4M15) TaxID=649349 RepID=E4RXX2_LEAB4|nr:RagB/SusD family nutrient uptake outer membrane protein [Leadbetterella byssophila]ADQ19069.1 RagB/SusD domain protein [Leadbetterella byssophila DSM 17132]